MTVESRRQAKPLCCPSSKSWNLQTQSPDRQYPCSKTRVIATYFGEASERIGLVEKSTNENMVGVLRVGSLNLKATDTYFSETG